MTLQPPRLKEVTLTSATLELPLVITNPNDFGLPVNGLSGTVIVAGAKVGTVSGPDRDNRGCLLELTWKGTEPVRLPNGEQRTFLQDGDRVTLSATAPGPDGSVIGLGEVTGTILSAVRR